MKNLMNRVLVVLAVSAVFAGSINASERRAARRASRAQAPVVNAVTESNGQMALDSLARNGRVARTYYTVENVKSDIAALQAAVPNAKAEIAILEKQALLEDYTARRASFSTGPAVQAIAIIKVAMTTTGLENATKKAEDQPSEENTKILAVKKIEAETNISELDKIAGDNKQYISRRGKVALAIGVASVVLTGLLYKYGVPKALAPYVPTVMTKLGASISNSIEATGGFLYSSAASMATAMGLGEEGMIGKAARAGYATAKNYGGQIAGAVGVTGVSSYISNKLGFNAVADAQNAANKAAADAAAAQRAADMAREASMPAYQ